MAHRIDDLLDRLDKREPVVCSSDCKYWHYPHLDVACVLSDVYSVRKGELCYNFTQKNVTIRQRTKQK